MALDLIETGTLIFTLSGSGPTHPPEWLHFATTLKWISIGSTLTLILFGFLIRAIDQNRGPCENFENQPRKDLMKTFFPMVVIAAMLSACSTVTIRDHGTAKVSSEPSYSSSKAFFFWGLAGTARINTTAICHGKRPVQMQSQKTFVDGLLGFLTLGIYSPRTASVWCTEEGGGSES